MVVDFPNVRLEILVKKYTGLKNNGSLDQRRLVFNCLEIYFDDTLREYLFRHPLHSTVKTQDLITRDSVTLALSLTRHFASVRGCYTLGRLGMGC